MIDARGQLCPMPVIMVLHPLQPHQLQYIGDAGADVTGRGPHRPHGKAQVVEHRLFGEHTVSWGGTATVDALGCGAYRGSAGRRCGSWRSR